jgi:BirA family biotin operon repressor/biotin-[acetyl-CoA-carboxylase] ligase
MDRLLAIANPFGGPVWYRDQTASTMDDAESLAARGEPEGCVAMAGHQLAGRGRFSTRRWEAEAGQSLLFTLVIPAGVAAPATGPGVLAPAARFPVSLVLGIGLALWLEGLGLRPHLKWPNDILIGERKLAGILVSTFRGHYHAGIGVNLRQAGFADRELSRPACSLAMAGLYLAPSAALASLLPCLRQAFDLEDPRAAWGPRLWRLGQEASFRTSPDAPPRHGVIRGLDRDGALILETPGGRESLISGECP